MRPRGPLLIALALLAAVAPAGCGRKGSPVAPEQRLPRPVADLSGTVQPGAIELSWTNPGRRVDSTRLRDLAVARVFRTEDAGAGDPKSALLVNGRIAGYTEVATIRLDAPAPAVVDGGRVRLEDRRDLAWGRRYTYVVVTGDARGRVSPPSTRLSLIYLATPDAPGGLAVQPGDREVRLTWQPPGRLADGGAATGPFAYEVLRASPPDGPLQPVARTEPGTAAFTDRGLDNDQTYAYAVRALRREAGTLARGPASGRVAATPADTTPPSRPAHLVVIPSEGQVRLAWNASPEPDVAAYVVYRAEAEGGFVRVGSTRPPTTVFVDREVPRGRYRYTVTALDASARPNESARSNEVTVSVP